MWLVVATKINYLNLQGTLVSQKLDIPRIRQVVIVWKRGILFSQGVEIGSEPDASTFSSQKLTSFCLKEGPYRLAISRIILSLPLTTIIQLLRCQASLLSKELNY